jgi:alcohol dehydrogenase class IV
VADLLHGLPRPRRLRDAGVAAADLGAIARATMADSMIAHAPRPVSEAEDRGLPEAGW